MRMKKIVALMLVGVLSVGCLTGCGGSRRSNKSKGEKVDIEISYFLAGMGKEWLEAVIEAFNEKYPQYNAFYNSSASVVASKTMFGLEDVDTTDLYLTSASAGTDLNDLVSLDDVLDSKAEGETKTIREKFNSAYLALETTNDGTIYTLTFGSGGLGFVYSKELFKKAGITQLPRTSDELAATCATLLDKGITPLLHHKNGHYVQSFDEIWYAQAVGEDAFLDLYLNPTLEKFKEKDGRYDVLKAMEKIITPEYVLNGSNTEPHTTMQTKFLAGEAAMTINGSWLQQEMGEEKGDAYEMMKTPVISSIKTRLTTIKSDHDLREIISAIDAVTDGDKTEDTYKNGENYKVGDIVVSADDWKEVKKARNGYVSVDPSSVGFIPAYSANIEGAKEFLRFLYSDEGIRIHADKTHIPLPMSLDSGELDISDYSPYEKNQYKLRMDAEWLVCSDYETRRQSALYSHGGAEILDISYVVNMCTKSEQQRQSAEDFWKAYMERIDSEYNTWTKNVE